MISTYFLLFVAKSTTADTRCRYLHAGPPRFAAPNLAYAALCFTPSANDLMLGSACNRSSDSFKSDVYNYLSFPRHWTPSLSPWKHSRLGIVARGLNKEASSGCWPHYPEALTRSKPDAQHRQWTLFRRIISLVHRLFRTCRQGDQQAIVFPSTGPNCPRMAQFGGLKLSGRVFDTLSF
jgi:hypothetical protein